MGMYDFMNAGAQTNIDANFGDAKGYLSPYVQGGYQDYSNLRNDTSNMGAMLGKYGNPGDYSWNQINQSPQQYYQNIMSGYSETPEAKYQQEMAMRASNQGASASGMLGSGAYFKELQNNANDISQRDRQQYFDNSMMSNQAQQQSLQNFQQQQMQQIMMQQYLTSMGYGAAGNSADIAMKQAELQAKLDEQNAENTGGMMGAVGTIGGGIVGAYFGGPAGAAAGAKIGGSLGGAAGGKK